MALKLYHAEPGANSLKSLIPLKEKGLEFESIYVDLHNTGSVSEEKVEKALREVMRLTPRGIREHLGLNKAIYARTAAYGHFGRKAGRDGGFSWEKTDLADAIKKAVNGKAA